VLFLFYKRFDSSKKKKIDVQSDSSTKGKRELSLNITYQAKSILVFVPGGNIKIGIYSNKQFIIYLIVFEMDLIQKPIC
jgi:hypothetical protein